MAEWQNGSMVEWRNGGMAEWECQNVEWQNGGMAGWQNGEMAEWYFTTYLIYPVIFMVHKDNANNDNDANGDADYTNGF
jgi:hypothetical protein